MLNAYTLTELGYVKHEAMEKENATRKEPIRGHTRPPQREREVYLAPEDDNRLQINCNYVDIVAGEVRAVWLGEVR